MHTQPIPESAGELSVPAEKLYDCQHCGARKCVTVCLWESSCGGYEDEKFQCTKCGEVWWVDGIDS